MPSLRHKTILLISPQAWGSMFLSKHHYAIELARRGNKVYFLTPLDELKESKSRKIIIQESGVENLLFIESKLFFPFQIKFHTVRLFNLLMKIQLKRILKKINHPIDIVWSFDLGNFFPFTFFDNTSFKIFHPVDEPLNKAAIESSKGADIIFSVTNEILNKYNDHDIPKYFINHGVSNRFLSDVVPQSETEHPIHVGFAGNLLRKDIDREILLTIIKENPTVIFEFWGSYEQSNISGSPDKESKNFITALQQFKNVMMHGIIPTGQLAKAFCNVDVFLICYDIQKDQSHGTNYHKILEYLGTGKVIVSNNVTAYHNYPNLIAMTEERAHNRSLPSLFKRVINDLSYHNSQKFQEERKVFANDNTYERQLNRIDTLIGKLA